MEAETGPHFPRGKVTIKFGELILSSNFDSGAISLIAHKFIQIYH